MYYRKDIFDKHGELAGINLENDTVDDLGLAE